MKTLTSPKTTTLPFSSRAKRLAQFLLGAVCMALITAGVTQEAAAAAPNGDYKYVSASGYLKFAGERMVLSKKDAKELIREAGLANETVTIKNKKLRINRDALIKDIVKEARKLGIPLKAKVTGPTSMTFKKSGKTYKAATAKPVVAKFTTEIQEQVIKGNVKARFKGTVKGRKLTMVVTLGGNVMGQKISGKITIVGKR